MTAIRSFMLRLMSAVKRAYMQALLSYTSPSNSMQIQLLLLLSAHALKTFTRRYD